MAKKVGCPDRESYHGETVIVLKVNISDYIISTMFLFFS